ncbi:PepSY-associated TM helix domain-containing protein [Actinokineospora guangxiensis]|uniref:PepSY-associated TM helix domain-containing protein n=1 Tax=Actinokineospora guangxiensis TaxID=1490288 RepID=A0ABW0ELQ5_9PSEU
MTTVQDPERDPDALLAEPARAEHLSAGRALRLVLRRVHFLAGLAIAPFLAVLAVTGLMYAFTPQLNDLVYGDKLSVSEDTAIGATTAPVDDQVAAALAAHPDGALKSVIVSADPERTTRVVLDVPGLDTSGGPFGSEAMTVYVNPHTAAVQGELITVSNEPPLQRWLRDLHGNLNLGDPGRLYAEFVASWLPAIVLGGLVLWFAARRRKTKKAAAGRARTSRWHGRVGVWAAIGLLVLSVTGLTWSTYAGARVSDFVDAVDGRSPTLESADVLPSAERISLERALATARDGGLEGDLILTAPTEPNRPLKINESSVGLPVQKDSVAVDQYTGAITGRVGWDDYPLMAKLTSLGIAAHSGNLFGIANQLLLAAVALAALALLVLGYRMWWKRRPRSGGLAPAPEPVWRRMPQPLVFGVLVVAAAVAWAMPVFGVTLLLFMIGDAAYGELRRRRRPQRV